jgi:DNA-binding response OmpR family regulator
MTNTADKSLHILVVDDDLRISRLISNYLSQEGYKVSTAINGQQMRQIFKRNVPDLVILDLVMPDDDGIELAKELRATSDVGIIMLTSKHEQVDKIIGLEVGADDYMTKPFDNRELLARIRSLGRRRHAQFSDSKPDEKYSQARFEGWTLNLTAHELISPEGENIHLTSYEFQLLSTLELNAHRAISWDHILDIMAGRDWVPNDRSIDVLIGKVRKKLRQNSQDPTLIKTIRAVGYMFTSQVEFE